jgi:hypothetical protein
MKSLKTALLIAILAGLALAQVGGPTNWTVLPDISGTGSAVQVASTVGGAAAIQFVAPSTNASTARWAFSSSVSATFGGILPPGAGQFLPVVTPNSYPLSKLYVYVASGDKLTITYAQ